MVSLPLPQLASIQSLAWFGDAVFELEVRKALFCAGDYKAERLDRAKSKIARAETQAELLARIEDRLQARERDLVARARNAAIRSRGRVRSSVKIYRSATALEALVGAWVAWEAWTRWEELLAPEILALVESSLDS